MMNLPEQDVTAEMSAVDRYGYVSYQAGKRHEMEEHRAFCLGETIPPSLSRAEQREYAARRAKRREARMVRESMAKIRSRWISMYQPV